MKSRKALVVGRSQAGSRIIGGGIGAGVGSPRVEGRGRLTPAPTHYECLREFGAGITF